MQTATATPPAYTSAAPKSKWRFVWVLPVLINAATGLAKVIGVEELRQNMASINGEHLMLPLGLVQLLGVVLAIIPRTRVAGFLLLLGYAGGIIATRLLHGEALGPGIAISVLLWVGLYFERPGLFRG